ncbi:vicilin-like seed storage protein At2g28490 [Elaeis guineensis]|uniref:Vicilin-like seed storage protein At2g28490 n=1 Tax=Elaeis guineensis var. tenera TaxID=51953 RepID=A0A6I9R9E2_ELAGV|nr:vicilin-like seed storage protein At2g28490 [Elaeis guineensis]
MVSAMGDRTASAILALLLLSSWCLMVVMAGRGMEGREKRVEEKAHRSPEDRGLFILRRSKEVLKTDAGKVRLVMGYRYRGNHSPMHIGFITMEPNTLYIPQYIDASLILFVRRGEAKVGYIYKNKLVEKRLRSGYIDAIPAGSSFYIVNSGKSERLHIICSIDNWESMDYGAYPQSFYIGGGVHPRSVLSGFDASTLSAAFNVSSDQLEMVLNRQRGGPIIRLSGEAADQPDYLSSIMQLKERMVQEKEMDSDDDDEAEQEEDDLWTWRCLLKSLLGKGDCRVQRRHRLVHSPASYNLYDTKPSYRNDYGYSIAIDKHDYSALRHSNLGVYLVNLKAGAMLSPHVNPTATEYGIILRGSGTIQVVFPNGTAAMNAKVSEGDVFWIPRYFPFCQIASDGAPLEFFGFTTSARKNRPQFLVGKSSLLHGMRGPELAAAFGVSEEQLERLVKAQREAVILPTSPHREMEESGKKWKGEEVLVMKRGLFA